MTAVPLTDIEPLLPVLTRRPLGVFSDIDGTLSPIVERPGDAKVTPRSRALLMDLIANGVKVALITGRTFAVARLMVGIEQAAYAANHGLEYWINGRVELADGVDEYVALAEQVTAETSDLRSADIQVEKKGPGLAFHYRRATDDNAARAAILHAIDSPAARRFTISEGRKVIELRPKVKANKGTATKLLANRLGLAGIICIGDDRTDLDMFKAAKHPREQDVKGIAVVVLSDESIPELLAAADYSVDGVAGVEWLLGEVATAVGGRSP